MKRFSLQAGMTLLEILVATAILAIISGMAFMSLNNLVAAKQTLDDKNSDLNQQNLAFFQFQNDLQMALSSQQIMSDLKQPEFMANSQSITLLKYKSMLAPINRNNNRQSRSVHSPMLRVRWYVRNNTWYRATQPAAAPLTANQWQERAMLTLDRFNCSYRNVSGQTQTAWPNEQRQYSQLPQQINCELTTSAGQTSYFKVAPWQVAGFL